MSEGEGEGEARRGIFSWQAKIGDVFSFGDGRSTWQLTLKLSLRTRSVQSFVLAALRDGAEVEDIEITRRGRKFPPGGPFLRAVGSSWRILIRSGPAGRVSVTPAPKAPPSTSSAAA